MREISENRLKALKAAYPEGTIVELVHMDDPYTKLPVGIRGKVICVDDMGTIHVSWSNGSSLGVAYGVDSVNVVKD